jgi:hypothetical protein
MEWTVKGEKNGNGRKSWRKKKGKPKRRCLDDIPEHMIRLGGNRWWIKSMDREERKKIS